MSLEANKAIVRKLIKAVNKHDLTALDELIVSDYVNQTMRMASREAFKKALSVQYGGFPDIHRTIEDIIAEGDKVWVRAKITGTHTGDYLGIAPTGKKFVMPA
ncbi:MAG: ester cyclase, partial [Candidatus Bathyarchaeota archaeon]